MGFPPGYYTIYEAHPPQGLFGARRGRNVFREFSVIDPPRGRPVGGSGSLSFRIVECNRSLFHLKPIFIVRGANSIRERFSRT